MGFSHLILACVPCGKVMRSEKCFDVSYFRVQFNLFTCM